MATHSQGKLNQLQRELPEGLLVDAAWLEARGYSRSLRSQYVRAGWLEAPARRVYRRPHSALTWRQAVLSLQTTLRYPLSVGGRTALEEYGYAHYLSTTTREVYLYGPRRPPTWLVDLPLDAAFRWRSGARLFPGDAYLRPDPSTAEAVDTAFPIVRSSKERAVFELLDELPAHESFQQADALMESLSDLSPCRLQTLLEACRSVKAKRLFLYFADRHRHAWSAKLDASRVDLGAGKRVLVKGGRLNARFRMTLPADLDER